MKAIQEKTEAQLEEAREEVERLKQWPIQLAGVTGLGITATAEETADFVAETTNIACERRDQLVEVREIVGLLTMLIVNKYDPKVGNHPLWEEYSSAGFPGEGHFPQWLQRKALAGKE